MVSIFQEREFRKYMLQSDNDDTGTLDFEEFKVAVKYAQGKTEKNPNYLQMRKRLKNQCLTPAKP